MCHPGVVIVSGGGRAVALQAAGLGDVARGLIVVPGTSRSRASSIFTSFGRPLWDALPFGLFLRLPQFFLFALSVERISFLELTFFPGGPHLIPVLIENELAGVLTKSEVTVVRLVGALVYLVVGLKVVVDVLLPRTKGWIVGLLVCPGEAIKPFMVGMAPRGVTVT